MPWTRRVDRNLEKFFRSNQPQVDRPTVLDRPGRYYETSLSRIPEKVRLSFSDGTTAVYRLEVELPEPIMRDWQSEVIVGYQWKGAKA